MKLAELSGKTSRERILKESQMGDLSQMAKFAAQCASERIQAYINMLQTG